MFILNLPSCSLCFTGLCCMPANMANGCRIWQDHSASLLLRWNTSVSASRSCALGLWPSWYPSFEHFLITNDIPIGLGRVWVDTVFQMLPHLCWAEENKISLPPLCSWCSWQPGCFPCNERQVLVSFWCVLSPKSFPSAPTWCCCMASSHFRCRPLTFSLLIQRKFLLIIFSNFFGLRLCHSACQPFCQILCHLWICWGFTLSHHPVCQWRYWTTLGSLITTYVLCLLPAIS